MFLLKNGIDINDDELFWVNTLTNIEDYIKHYKIDLKDISCEKFSFSDDLFQKINKFTEKYEISYFKFLISIFALYLSRVDRTGGCILKSRILDEISKSELGTLLKIDYNKKNSFIEHMDCVSDSYDIANVHTKTDVEDYVGNIVDLVHYSVNDISKVSEYVDKNSVLTFNVCLKNLEIRYNTSLFDEIYIKHMIDNLLAMINDVIDSPNTYCKDINILSDAEKSLINEFCKGDTVDFDDDYTLAKAFRDSSLKNPNKIAVDDGINQITYGDLEKSSNSIAYDLQNNYGIKKGTPVCLMLPRTYHFVELVLALNKIGSYYIPIDSNYPIKRIEHIVNLSESKHIILNEDFKNLHNFDIESICHEDLNRNLNADIEIDSNGDDLFCILFTSGTTGLPKGVIFHNKQINNWNALFHMIKPSFDGIVGIYREFTFVGSFWLFASFYQNMTSRIYNEYEQKNIPYLINEFKENLIYLIDLPDSLISLLSDEGSIGIKYLLTGGSKINNLYSNDTQFIIIYGTTEVNMTSLYYFDPDKNLDDIPIGRPTVNKWIYILDDESNLMPVGVPGEICVSSDYISSGYLNNPDSTQKAFVDNPFSDCKKNRRLYHTGDIGFYNFDGNLNIIGRMDDQLSVRGFRVESDEISNIMKGFEGISEVILNVFDDNLIVYYMKNQDIVIEDIKLELKKNLPSYMIPSIFIEIDKVPLNINGKIDKFKLPKPSIFTENVNPKNEIEKELLLMCQNILKNDNFGVTDNLLSLGFSSLSFMNLNYQIHSKLDINLNIIDLLECNNVREIFNILNNSNSQKFKKFDKKELYPLTKNQIIVCESRKSNPNVFKLYYSLKIKDVDVNKLKNSFIKAINNHSFLKSSIVNKDGIFYIKRDDDADISNLVKIYNVNKQEFDLFEKNIFELDSDFYFKYFKDGLEKYFDKFFYCVIVEYENDVIIRLLFDHLAFDHYSISLLLSEIDKIYFNREDEIDEEIIDGFDYNLFIVNDEKESSDFFEKYRDEVINYGDLFIPPIYEYDNDCCEIDELNYKINKHDIQTFSNKHNIPYNQFFMATFVLALHKYSGLTKGILPVVSNGRFFNELVNTHHYLAKTIYLKFQFDKFVYLKDVFNHISDEMMRIIKMEPNSLYFVYGNQWLFNFIETSSDLNFNSTELINDENKPSLIRNVGKNFLNDLIIWEMNDFYNISLKYHNKRYNEKYLSSFLDSWYKIMKVIVCEDNLDMPFDFLKEI